MESKLFFEDGRILNVVPELLHRPFRLGQLVDLVDGVNIEILKLPTGRILVLDKDGQSKGKGVNFLVTHMANGLGILRDGEYLVGNILLCDAEMVE